MLEALLIMAIGTTSFVPKEAHALLDSMRSAIGAAQLKVIGPQFVLEGTIERYGASGGFRLSVDQSGRFVRQSGGVLSDTQAFDGHTGWRTDLAGMPSTLGMSDLEIAQLQHWVLSGLWLAQPGLVEVCGVSRSEDESTSTLTIRVAGGRIDAELAVNVATGLPISLSAPSVGGDVVSTFEDYGGDAGYRFPRRVHRTMAGIASETVALQRCSPLTAPLDEALRRPAPIDDSNFVADSAVVETKLAPTGHLLVRLRIDDQEAPLFIFDTGAGAMVIAKALREKLGLDAVGQAPLVSLFGAELANIYRAKSLSFGPMRLTRPFLVEMDLAMLEAYFGEPIGGVVGFDVLSRSLLEIDPTAPTIEVHDPHKHDVSAIEWMDIQFNGGHPHMAATFEGGDGIFRLDLGAAGGPGGNVIFHADVVRRFDLLASQDAGNKELIGDTEVVNGEIAWFALAGKRFENVAAAFALGESGLFATDPYGAGNIGVGLLGQFRIVLDLGRDRVALIKKP